MLDMGLPPRRKKKKKKREKKRGREKKRSRRCSAWPPLPQHPKEVTVSAAATARRRCCKASSCIRRKKKRKKEEVKNAWCSAIASAMSLHSTPTFEEALPQCRRVARRPESIPPEKKKGEEKRRGGEGRRRRPRACDIRRHEPRVSTRRAVLRPKTIVPSHRRTGRAGKTGHERGKRKKKEGKKKEKKKKKGREEKRKRRPPSARRCEVEVNDRSFRRVPRCVPMLCTYLRLERTS